MTGKKQSPIARVFGKIIAILAIAVVLGGVYIFLIGNTAEAIANISTSLGKFLGNVSNAAEGVANAVDITADKVIDPNKFIRVQSEYVLRPEDLSETYVIDSGEESRYANSTIIQEAGQVDGKSYVKETGRVDGWQIRLKRKYNTAVAPAIYESTVSVFASSAGAREAISPAWFWAYDDAVTYTFIDYGCDIGDKCILYSYEEFNPANGVVTLRYDVAFVYHNVLVWVSGRGLEVEVSEDDVLSAAQSIFDRLIKLDLVTAK
ncbi:MAG: hypothetical protein OEZ02_10975 [Anaerolineae bacterium]|nr:hypothetical protein [Anaerolineae bacterium]